MPSPSGRSWCSGAGTRRPRERGARPRRSSTTCRCFRCRRADPDPHPGTVGGRGAASRGPSRRAQPARGAALVYETPPARRPLIIQGRAGGLSPRAADARGGKTMTPASDAAFDRHRRAERFLPGGALGGGWRRGGRADQPPARRFAIRVLTRTGTGRAPFLRRDPPGAAFLAPADALRSPVLWPTTACGAAGRRLPSRLDTGRRRSRDPQGLPIRHRQLFRLPRTTGRRRPAFPYLRERSALRLALRPRHPTSPPILR